MLIIKDAYNSAIECYGTLRADLKEFMPHL